MARRLGIVAERALDLGYLDRLIDTKRQERSTLGGVELAVEAQRDVRSEREARSRVGHTTVFDAFVQIAQRAVRVELEHDDVRLHEPNGLPQPQRERWGGARDGLDQRPQLLDGRCGSDRSRARRSDDGDVRRHEPRELWIETGLNFADQSSERRLEWGDDVDARPRPPASGRVGRGPAWLSLHRVSGTMDQIISSRPVLATMPGGGIIAAL